MIGWPRIDLPSLEAIHHVRAAWLLTRNTTTHNLLNTSAIRKFRSHLRYRDIDSPRFLQIGLAIHLVVAMHCRTQNNVANNEACETSLDRLNIA